MKNLSGVVVASISFIVGLAVLGNAYINRNTGADRIEVTGLGKKDFTSDLIVWKSSFGKTNPDLQKAYDLLKSDREAVLSFLKNAGVDESEVIFESVDIRKEYESEYDANGRFRQGPFKHYALNQRVSVESKKVEAVEKVSREVSQLINQGIELYSERPQYYYTKLADLKLEMIAEATDDARQRAELIANNANADLAELRSARMGVFQIIGQNSNEDYSWGGSYNTYSKNKTATITMRLTYGIN
jgi:hypothetical protein